MKYNKKNLILITIDTLRLDHLNIMNYKKNTTPFLSNLSKEGIFFRNVITNGPWTAPSFSSIFTSIYPFHRGGYAPLPENKITLAEILQANGYFNMAIHSTPLLSRFYGYDRGFNLFYDSMLKKENNIIKNYVLNKVLNKKALTVNIIDYLQGLNIPKTLQYYFLITFYNLLIGKLDYYKKARYLFQKAIKWIDYYINKYHDKKPFFLWVHLMDPHDPYFPSTEIINLIGCKNLTIKEIKYIQKHPHYINKLREQNMVNKLIDLYDSEIRYVDDNIKEFFGVLKKEYNYLLENSVVFITADHGDEFNERGSFGHNAKLYDELLRVPLILSSDYLKEKKGLKNKEIYSLINMRDFAPTILDLLDITPNPSFEGKSFADLIYDDKEIQNDSIDDGVFSETYHKKFFIKFTNKNDREVRRIISYRTIKWKYIINEQNHHEELYDLENDPRELNNVVSSYPKLARIFKSKIINHLKENCTIKKEKNDLIEKMKISLAIKKLDLFNKPLIF
ncbi:MAG: sulfatase [Candidatus Helarchaeota archaeon]